MTKKMLENDKNENCGEFHFRHAISQNGFLDAFSHLYKRVCPSVGPSVRPSVGPSVRRSHTS